MKMSKCYITVFFNTNIEEYVQVNDDIIIVVVDNMDNQTAIEEKLEGHNQVYELRFISCTVTLEGDYKWNGKIFCRHGGHHHKSWWVLQRHNKFFQQTPNGTFEDIDINEVDICVYVKM